MIVRNDNSKLVKRDGLQLTSEAGNLANRNTFKYSGIANVRTVDMSIDAEGKVSLGLAAAKNLNKPASSVRTAPLNKNFRRVAQSLKKQLAGQCYRGDLTAMALARWTALHRLSKVKAGLAKKTKTKAPHHPKA